MAQKHAQAAQSFINNETKAQWHDGALWKVREKRDAAAANIPEWEHLRNLASQIKEHTLSQLDQYLLEFEANAKEKGIKVHWAEDAAAHNRIVLKILAEVGARKLVKSKSMLTEECGLNEHLEKNGIEVVDTDLGERIIQLNEQPPSHIVMPAIHMDRHEISDLFHEKLDAEKNNANPNYLTETARQHLRYKFLQADVALTGVNFAIAESGGVVVCTNEGNADMGVHLAPVQIHCMGIEKLVPKTSHMGVFTRLLARSATGQPITVYTSHYQKPKLNGQMHVVIVDNGRSEHLGKPQFRNGLKCIRCGACMNTCPVYRRSGGHSYHATIPGPIGSILNPRTDLKAYSDLPFASSLCGSCSDVCPVKINIHEQLYSWRQIIEQNKKGINFNKWVMRQVARVLSRPRSYDRMGKWMRAMLKITPDFIIKNRLNTWSIGRELPNVPPHSFKEWYRRNRKHGKR